VNARAGRRCTAEQPILVGSMAIMFRCGCGWESEAVRPEIAGTFRRVCAQYREHLSAAGFYDKRPAGPAEQA
jgi:hypothetical protein